MYQLNFGNINKLIGQLYFIFYLQFTVSQNEKFTGKKYLTSLEYQSYFF